MPTMLCRRIRFRFCNAYRQTPGFFRKFTTRCVKLTGSKRTAITHFICAFTQTFETEETLCGLSVYLDHVVFVSPGIYSNYSGGGKEIYDRVPTTFNPTRVASELEEKLQRYLEGSQQEGDWYRGQVKRYDPIGAFASDEDGQKTILAWMSKGKYEKLLTWWVKGLNVDWKHLYAVGARTGASPVPTAPALPRRISLPTYPFARKRYWLPTLTVKAVPLHDRSTRALTTQEEMPTLLLTPGWKEETMTEEQALPLHLSQEAPLLAQQMAPAAVSLVLLCDLPGIEASRIHASLAADGHCPSLKVKHWSSLQIRRELRFQDAVLQLIQELQTLLQGRPAGLVLVQAVVAQRQQPSLLEALTGVLKTAQQEYPKLRTQLIEVEGEPTEKALLTWLRENRHRLHESHIRYRNGKRGVREWQEVNGGKPGPDVLPWKEGGCYLITGGTGGMARLFVQEIARQVQEATVILVGRSALSAERCEQLVVACGLAPQGENKGIHIDYQQVDVRDGQAVHALVQRVIEKSGHLNGIIHAAGALHDSLLPNKTPEEIQAVLAPKVIGVEHLDEASREVPLDFFVLCSSLAAVMGNLGQADYSGANAYLDAFAHARQAQVLAGERHGTTVSINWPLWEEGGMHMDASMIQMMRDLLGVEAMPTKTGMKVLYQALASHQAQVIVAHGQVERIKECLLSRSLEPGVRTASPSESTSNLDRDVLSAMLQEALIHMVSDLLKIGVEEIDSETELSEYGFDSVTFTQFANRLNQSYQLDLSPPLFYEYSTLERLAQYLQTTYASVLAPHFASLPPKVSTQMDLTPDKLPPVEAEPSIATTTPLPGQAPHRVTSSLMEVPEQRVQAGTEPIAIIGMSGIFPQAPDVQHFWRNLLAGRDCIGEIPAERWDWQTYCGHTAATEVNSHNIKWAGIVEGIELFDPLFFGISPREAERMDPQQRLLMMYVWKAIEDAGYAAESLSGTNTALFVGTAGSGYGERVSHANMTIEGFSATSLTPSMGPGRMSYFLNLHGPSEPIETACSSSLVAIHRGVNAIESGQCNMAIVGGVNTLISPELHISLSKAGMLSEDGRCKTFGASANGFVRGEGVGMLVLKPLSAAERDGDHIYGLIRGSAENHGGRANSLTAPNPRAQTDLLIAAYRKAGIDPRTVGYIEAHGTGTELGDPIEINGLKMAFSELAQALGSEDPLPNATCGIGSVKSNIGHLELAAGVAGVIKVLLQLQHKTLVKSLHCEQINPYIQLDTSPFSIVQQNREWEAQRDRAGNTLPRRAGVSSFGFGGVNAHVVLEEYVPKPRATPVSNHVPLPEQGQALPPLIVLSARNKEQLYEQVRQLRLWVQEVVRTEEPVGQARHQSLGQSLHNLAYTLQVGRSAMEERLALQVSSFAELEEKLHRYLHDPREDGDYWYRGQMKQYKETAAPLGTSEELQEAISKWLQHGNYEKLLQGWVKGLPIDWQCLYGEERPLRISLPTYPFAQERYWISTTSSTTPVAAAPISSIPSRSLGTSLLSIAQSEAGTSTPILQGTQATTIAKTSENGRVLRASSASPNRVALRSLADYPLPSQGSNLSLSTDFPETDSLQPAVTLSLSSQPFSASRSNDAIAPEVVKVSTPVQPNTHDTTTNTQITWSEVDPGPVVDTGLAPSLEEELSRSLAQTLYMEQSDVDIEKPFVTMGLDSVVGVEWIQSLNKQYACNLKASVVYDYSTIRQLAGFLQKDVLKHGGRTQQTPTQSVLTLSLDDLLQRVQQGTFEIEKAGQLLRQVFL